MKRSKQGRRIRISFPWDSCPDDKPDHLKRIYTRCWIEERKKGTDSGAVILSHHMDAHFFFHSTDYTPISCWYLSALATLGRVKSASGCLDSSLRCIKMHMYIIIKFCIVLLVYPFFHSQIVLTIDTYPTSD